MSRLSFSVSLCFCMACFVRTCVGACQDSPRCLSRTHNYCTHATHLLRPLSRSFSLLGSLLLSLALGLRLLLLCRQPRSLFLLLPQARLLLLSVLLLQRCPLFRLLSRKLLFCCLHSPPLLFSSLLQLGVRAPLPQDHIRMLVDESLNNLRILVRKHSAHVSSHLIKQTLLQLLQFSRAHLVYFAQRVQTHDPLDRFFHRLSIPGLRLPSHCPRRCHFCRVCYHR